MAKVELPLFSKAASGSIRRALTFGQNQFGSWVRHLYKITTTYLPSQLEIRQWFKNVVEYSLDMADEEKFLWWLVLRNAKQYNIRRIEKANRTWRCHLFHWILSTKSFIWDGSPFPPELRQWLAKDSIANYEQLMSDLETLTGLLFCDSVNPYFFPFLYEYTTPGHPKYGSTVVGFASVRGAAIALLESYWNDADAWERNRLTVHELTHCLMAQHGWIYRAAVKDSETIADECGERVANGQLEPIYTYKGKTLSEWVPNPQC